MRCHEVRQFLGPYLDSELDAKTSLEIQQHLEACPDCARVFAAEEKLDAHIFSALRGGQRTAELWDGIETRIKPRRFAWLAVAMPAVACVVAVVSFGWWKTHRLEVAVAAAHCHREYVEGIIGPQPAGNLPANLDAGAFAIRPAPKMFQPAGTRLCHLDGVPVAAVLGHSEAAPVSMIVFRRSELDHFPVTKRRLETGEPVVCARIGRYHFAIRLLGEHVVCAIGETPVARLEELVKSAS